MTAPRTITVLVIPPGDTPAYLETVPATLTAMQELVGGLVEPLNLSPEVVMYLNEEGKYIGLPVNANANKVVFLADPGLTPGDYIVGPVVLVGVLNATGTFDGDDHDVPDSATELCRRAGVPVEDRTNRK